MPANSSLLPDSALVRLADEVELAIERALGQRVDVEIDPIRGTVRASIPGGGPSIEISPGPGLMRKVFAFARAAALRVFRFIF